MPFSHGNNPGIVSKICKIARPITSQGIYNNNNLNTYNFGC
ncbi:GSCOCG00000604001-RA-CDS [Cotesia congregata]|nr:GSCOCG00000604001-RA-CDS [Cotesia congregata]